MERMVAPVIEAIWRKVVESFSSKVVEQVADGALDSVNNVRDFELIFENLQKNLKSLSAKAADVEEEIKNAELLGRKKRKREVKEWLEEVESIKQIVVELGSQIESQGFVTRLTDGGKAAQLDKQIQKLLEHRLNFTELILDVCGTSGDIFLTNGLVGQAFSENLETILRLLEGTKVSSIGVYGMGGVGKTTLVKHINNRLLQRSEGRVFWVTVSHEFTITSLQDRIARCVGVDLSDEDNEDKRASRLHKALSAMKNSVLILDDVWDYIDVLKVGCSVSAEWCRLIITTRSFSVCGRIGCQRKIPIEKLNEGEAWKLFNERLGNEEELDPEVEGIAKSMVKLCGGLPLGIITMAGSMRGKKGIHRWRNDLLELRGCVQEKDGMDDDEVFEVLKFSFDRLKKRNDNSNEFNMKQLCFLYCSLYPEDYKIDRKVLVRQFISEGLLDERKSRRARVDQGHSILDELVDVCLLETCVQYRKECVKMHDLVRSMALKICEGKHMVRAGDWSLKEILNEEEWTKDLEKVSFMMCHDLVCIREGISPDCPKLSTLIFWENQKLKSIPESFFTRMQGLCTLDLCKTGIWILPKSVCDLTCLKALLLKDCYMLKKVSYLGNLKALRELDLSSTAIKEAPRGLEELLNLRFLSMSARGLKMLPRGVLLKLGHLQCLNLPLHIQVDIKEIKNLKQLEEFDGGVNNVSGFNCFITTRACDPCYTIAINLKNDFDFYLGGRLGCEENTLMLCESNLKDEKILGQGIVDLSIYRCEGMSECFVDDLPQRFDNPTSLTKLRIWKCGGIECIMRNDGQGSQISNTLKEIRLQYLDDLKRVVMERAEIAASNIAPILPAIFSSLRMIIIDNCSKMRKLGFAVTRLPNLECISIWSCEEIEEIFEEDERRAASIITTLPKFNSLSLNGLPRLRKVGLPIQAIPNLESIYIAKCGDIEEIFEEDGGRDASIITTLPRLRTLRLEELPRLKSVSKATIISNSISEITIWGCPRLNKLPLHIDDPPSTLRIYVGSAWWESLEWDINPNLPLLLRRFVEFYDFKLFV